MCFTFAFGTGVDDTLRLMGKPGQMNAIFLTEKCLVMIAVSSFVERKGIIIEGSNEKLALIVVVKRRHRCI